MLAIIAFLFGSFANVLIHRIPNGHSIFAPRSHCPKCGYQLKWFENIPIISYVILQGQCSKCKTNIPLSYPVVEAIVGMLGIIMLQFSTSVVEYFFYLILITIVVALGFIDYKAQRLPHALTYSAILFVIFYSSLFWNPFYAPVIAFHNLPAKLAMSATSIAYLGLAFFVVDCFTHCANLFYFKDEALKLASSALTFRSEKLIKHVTWIYILIAGLELYLAFNYPLVIFYYFNCALGLSYLINEICIDYIFASETDEEIPADGKTILGGGDASFVAMAAVILGPLHALIVFVLACYIALTQRVIDKIKEKIKKESLERRYMPLGPGLAFALIAVMMFLKASFRLI
ncbi:MAG: prepilin peptidase [Candidatus Melainabacteria bacterium]|nr:prepilin peptidase [Candidatus Melainabacteria bacterium]